MDKFAVLRERIELCSDIEVYEQEGEIILTIPQYCRGEMYLNKDNVEALAEYFGITGEIGDNE